MSAQKLKLYEQVNSKALQTGSVITAIIDPEQIKNKRYFQDMTSKLVQVQDKRDPNNSNIVYKLNTGSSECRVMFTKML